MNAVLLSVCLLTPAHHDADAAACLALASAAKSVALKAKATKCKCLAGLACTCAVCECEKGLPPARKPKAIAERSCGCSDRCACGCVSGESCRCADAAPAVRYYHPPTYQNAPSVHYSLPAVRQGVPTFNAARAVSVQAQTRQTMVAPAPVRVMSGDC